MTNDWTARPAPNLEDIAAMARAARATLPDAYRPAAAELSLRSEDFAADASLDEMESRDPFSLTGLCDGIPLTEKSVMDQPQGPNTI